MSKTSSVLSLLKQNRKYGVYSTELAKPVYGGLGYRSRITDLRKSGHNIQCVRIKNGINKFYLLDDEDDRQETVFSKLKRKFGL